MRVKINVDEYGIPPLVYGKTYFLDYAGITYGEEFLYTRKNRIKLREVHLSDGNPFEVSSHWISKKALKQLLKSGGIRGLAAFDDPS